MAKTNHEMLPSSLNETMSSTKVSSQTNITPKKSIIGLKQLPKTSKKSCSEISFKDFLHFLQTAYQVNECVEGNVASTGFDWKSVAGNPLIASILGTNEEQVQKVSEQTSIENAVEEAKKEMAEICSENKFLSLKKAESTSLEKMKSNASEVSGEVRMVSKKLPEHKNVEQILKRKLNEIIQEGLLDSVLPYVVPKQTVCPQSTPKKSFSELNKPAVGGDKVTLQSTPKEKSSSTTKRKSSSSGEIEVEIHVCDEVKNLKRDFRCPQKLLVSKMGYFAEVTTGQKLEDMDISVHCDITIFDWLMRWVKKDTQPVETWPSLDPSNVVPILVSAAFLQMDPLLQDCLNFCRQHMNDIVKASTNLACLNDNILTRLANLFSNVDVENLRDRKDKIQTRLYCKLITALTESTPDPARGHFASLASMYKCSKCERLVLRQLSSHILCKPSSMKMDRFGNISAIHVRDINWNLNDYIRKLHEELKSWRAVYWRLWGDCHFLSCTTCHHYFPVYQIGWCCYHPEQPQFFTMEHQRSLMYPIGRFPCCGERAYRFEVLRNQSGCQFREHTASLNTDKEVAMHKIFMQHKTLISQEAPKLVFPERLIRLVSNRGETDKVVGNEVTSRSSNRESLWWEGMELAPPRPRQGLLCRLWDTQTKESSQNQTASDTGNNKQMQQTNSAVSLNLQGQHQNQPSPVTDTPVPCDRFSDITSHYSSDDDTSSDGNISEESAGHVRKLRSPPKLKKSKHLHHHGKQRVDGCRQWLANLSIRSNQDNQREYEENLMRQMTQALTRRTCGRITTRMCRSPKVHGHGYYHSSIWNNHITPIGGTYVRLEQEWKEGVNHGRYASQLTRQRSTNSLSARPKLRVSR